MRLIIGISGASGVIYGIRLLETLRQQADVETHLVMSATGRRRMWRSSLMSSIATTMSAQ
jgi:4-hydroxy-3-polyprenylbenzoate decarboxylase